MAFGVSGIEQRRGLVLDTRHKVLHVACLHERRANEQRRLVVCVSNNDLALLEYLCTTVRAGLITKKRVYSVSLAPSFAFQILSRQALELLRQVEPYMRTYKAIRARLALVNYVALTPRNGKYSPDIDAVRADFEQSFLATLPACAV